MILKKINKSDLEDIYKREKRYLVKAVEDGKSPYHLFTLSTINDDSPELRIVVLRKVNINPFKLSFNSDIRSPKAYQLKNNKYCNVLFYDSIRRIQMRFKCLITINHKNNISQEVWNQTALQSRKCYMGPHSPTSILEAWHPNLPIDCIERDPSEEESQSGYKNFMNIELEIIKADILELHYNGHIRFEVLKNDKINFLSA
tara:strand:+ start:1124 stop:1726 length:603 start_codon:yes stop_codon:yes gene_type:complete